jgi:DNA replication protein DnaC
MNRSLVFDLATCAFIGKREDALFLGPGGTGKSHLAQAIGQTAIQQNYRVMEDWGKLLGDVAAVTAMLDRLLHHGHVLKCGPRSWRTKLGAATAAESH